MNPGESTVLNPDELRKLKTQTIIRVDLVYSDYPKGADLSGLNRDRIIELYKFLPMAFNNSLVEWNLIKQLDVKSEADMQRYFHGFVIYYRKMPTFQQENKTILDVVKGKAKPEDSTLLKVFERNKAWKDMLVVCDVTGSMSPYTAQLLLWIAANNKMKTFKQIVFLMTTIPRVRIKNKDLMIMGFGLLTKQNWSLCLMWLLKLWKRVDTKKMILKPFVMR